jgi:hypothetical protein
VSDERSTDEQVEDVEGHKFVHSRDDEQMPEPGEGKVAKPREEDDGPDVEGHRWSRP